MVCWFNFRLIFTIETKLGVFTPDTLSWLLLLLLPENSLLFLHSLVPLGSLITKTCSRASTAARLRAQNVLGQKWLLLCQEIHYGFPVFRDALLYLLTVVGLRVVCLLT